MNSKILFYIEQPPPIHGMTYINKIIYDNLNNENGCYFYNTNFSVDINDISKVSNKKIFKNIAIMLGAWKSFFSVNPKKVYTILSATKFGIIRDFMINLPSILFNKKLVLHLHGFTYYKIYRKSIIYRILFNIMSRNSEIIVLCEKQKAETLAIMDKDSNILYNCLDNDVKNSVIIKNDILQLCYISNISKEKGTFDLVKAIQKSQKNIKLIIAGNFLADKETFLQLIKESNNIIYVGFADKKIKQNILKNSDIFCLPSKLEEGSPISIIEAMSYGLPILATDKGCIKDMINSIGYILPDNYKNQDIINGLDFIENNYTKMSMMSLNKYEENYSQDKFISNLKNILQR